VFSKVTVKQQELPGGAMRIPSLAVILSMIIVLQACTSDKVHDDIVRLNGFTASLPAGEAWIRTDLSPTRAAYQGTENGKMTLLRFSIDTIAPMPQAQAFFEYAERRQEQLFAGSKAISIHYNRTTKDNTPCLQYDGIFEWESRTTSPFTTLRGFIFRHPDDPNRILNVELSQDCSGKSEAYAVDLTETARLVFNSVHFTKYADMR
jgi:hypothetical protein